MDPDHDAVSALRASAHPVRLRMLSLLTGTALSAAEVARELGLTHANASYHLRVLLDAGELEVAGEERIRGGVAKRYRYPLERFREQATAGATVHRSSRAGPEDQGSYVRAVASELRRRLAAQPETDRQTLHADLEGWVTPQVWQRAQALVEEAVLLLHDENRPPRTEGTVHVSATAWLFRMGDEA